MSLFKKLGSIFTSERDSTHDFGWHSISEEVEIADIRLSSNKRPQVIYKHSTRCATSFFALKNIQDLSDEVREKADFHMVNVISERPISRHIAETFSVRHESPQLIILKNGEVFWHGSHHNVTAELIETNLKPDN